MISITISTSVTYSTFATNLPFTIQPQIPQYNESQRLRKAHNAARRLAPHLAVYQDTVTPHRGHMPAVHTLSYQSFHCQPMTVTHVIGYNLETPLRH